MFEFDEFGPTRVVQLIPAPGWTAVFRTDRQGDIRLRVGAWVLAEWETDAGPFQRVVGMVALTSEVSLIPATNEEVIGAAFLRYEVGQSDA
jgi:hypothetical protein